MKYVDIHQPFLDLSSYELRQLCFVAYFGEECSSALSQYLKFFHTNKEAYDETALFLQQKGYLLTRNATSPEHHFDILDYLATRKPDWAETFRHLPGCSPAHSNEYLWRLAKMLRNDDFEEAARMPKPYEGLGKKMFNVFPYIRKRALTDSRYSHLLDSEQIFSMTSETLEDLFLKGTLDGQAIQSIRKMTPHYHPQYQELMEMIAFYDFLVSGTYTFSDTPRTLWSLMKEAICALYRGDVEDSLAFFRKALQMRGRKIGVFPLSIVNYFYVVCILKFRTKYGQTKCIEELNALRQSSTIRNDRSHFAAKLLMDYAEVAHESAQTEVLRQIDMALDSADNHLNRCFAQLMANYFNLENERRFTITPTASIVLHELSPYLQLGANTIEELGQLYGGKPLLSSLRKKAPWEILLGEIDEVAEKSVDEHPRRIVYFLNKDRLSGIVEQVELEPDLWKDGQLLSAKVMLIEGYDSMDVCDSRIAMQLATKEEWQTDADIIVPHLIGTDRLYYGVEYLPERTLASIEAERPYVEFHGEADRIVVSTNARQTPDGRLRKHTVSVSDKNYTIITLNPLQKDILEKLLSTQSFPASAAPSLRKTIESLKGIIDVRENILDDIESNAIDSEGTLAIRIEPVEREYQMSIFASPLRGGTARLVPTAGEELVYDEDETGRSHCVRRNFTAEKENFILLKDFAQQFGMEFTSENVCIIGEERNLLQLLAFCHQHQELFMIEWPKGQVLKFKGILTNNDINIDVRGDNEWFTVEGNVNIGGQKMTLEELLKAYCHSGHDDFVCIGENEYVQMTETLRKHVAELDAVLGMDERKRKKVPKYLVGALAKTLDQMNYHTDNSYRELMLKMKEAYEKDIPMPEGLQATLRPYQIEGFVWMKRLDEWGAGACLADDMGLGKTLQALAFILSKANEGPSIVVAPKSVLPNWVKETQRFAPDLSITVLNDTGSRRDTIKQAGPFALVLCTYGVLTTESELLASKAWCVACLDEAQQIKNRTTYVSQAAMNLKTQSRIILTGTPLQNHVGELWNLMQFINPGLLGRWNVFRDSFVNVTLDEEHRQMLKEMTQPFILRRTKQQVLADLPEKTEDVHFVTMNDGEMAVYEEMRKTVEIKFKKGKNKAERDAVKDIDISYFEELMKLRLCCCDMHLVYSAWNNQSTKITALMEILDTLMDIPENNVLVFSQFTSFLARIKPEVGKHGWDYLYLDGQTPMGMRQKMVEQFQKGEKRLFLSSLKAGGLGINLTAANYVILLDPWWNPAIENQATDRAHRIGQKRCVSVIRLISEHTIEEKILRLHEKKQQLSDDVLDGTSDSNKLTYEDILDMVSPY